MSGKRRDKKGRILRPGEYQRADLVYQYRYVDVRGVRRYVYSASLEELREKENTICRDVDDGIDYAAGEITVSELVKKYMSIKCGLSENSKRAYGSAVNRIVKSDFGCRKIRYVKVSDAKYWFVSLHDEGLKRNTIGVIQSVIRPAFEMAVDDDIIRKNPFKFDMTELIPEDAFVRDALTREQIEHYLQFVEEQGRGNYYDDIIILLGTGLRVSELYGLTKSDVDFNKRCIHIEHQLCRTADKPYFIAPPKTKSGIRCIPMSPSVYEAFCRVVRKRETPKVEMLIDGLSGFLFLDKSGMPKVAMHLENYMRGLQKKHVKLFGRALPTITPHVLRHTFCTNAQQAGIDVKSLQYLMGHSNASVTLDVYTHTDYSAVERAFQKIASNL